MTKYQKITTHKNDRVPVPAGVVNKKNQAYICTFAFPLDLPILPIL